MLRDGNHSNDYLQDGIRDDSHALAMHHAILIGINAYPQKPLQGCVPDVQNIQRYFEGASQKRLVTQVFTASTKNQNLSSSDLKSAPATTAHASLPSLEEPAARQATYDNVTRALYDVARDASPGDFVYIHYSGHGTRAPSMNRLSNRDTGDLALVLLDEHSKGGTKCLWGPQLAELLKAMVDKGLVVTLVLDCCFSASVFRWDDPDSRFLPYSPEIDAGLPPPPPPPSSSFPSEPTTEEDSGDGGGGSGGEAPFPTTGSHDLPDSSSNRDGSRNISMLPAWLVNPDGYTILVACGPDEEAREPRIDGARHGALSYCLLRTLTECGGLVRRHGAVYAHLRAAFRRYGLHRAPQHPVLYGNADLGFFGHPHADRNAKAALVLVRRGDGDSATIELQAGAAHGISVGDQFVLRPFDWEAAALEERKPASAAPLEDNNGSSSSSSSTVVAKVIRTGTFTAVLERIDDGGGASAEVVKTGWIASPLTWLALRRFPIRLDAGLPYRDGWLTVLQGRSLAFCSTDGEAEADADNTSRPPPAAFHVVLDDQDHYAIREGETGQAIPHLPPMPRDGTDANQVYSLLEHLARYKLAQALAPATAPDPNFTASFRLRVTTPSRPQPLESGDWLQVRHDEAVKFTLTLENLNQDPRKKLYVYIYNLGPRWEIQNIYRGTYEAVPPANPAQGFTGRMQKTLRLVVPTELLRMAPPRSQQRQPQGQQQQQQQWFCEDTIKVFVTSEPTSFALLELPKLGEIFDGGNILQGPHRGGVLVKEDWVAFNYLIRTSLQ